MDHDARVRQRRALAFQGEVVGCDGRTFSEVFVVDLPDDLTVPDAEPLEGTLHRRPAPPQDATPEPRHPPAVARLRARHLGDLRRHDRSGVVHGAVEDRRRRRRHDCERRVVELPVAVAGRARRRTDSRRDHRHCDRPAAGPLPAAGRRLRLLHHVPLLDPERRARAADRAVGRLRDDGEDHHPVHVRVLPDGHQHLPGRPQRRHQAAGSGPRVPLLGAPAVGEHRAARRPPLHRHRRAPRARHECDRNRRRHHPHRRDRDVLRCEGRHDRGLCGRFVLEFLDDLRLFLFVQQHRAFVL